MDAMKSAHFATINLNGDLIDLRIPVVMGILNVTPDSFYASSRYQNEKAIIERAIQIQEEGGLIIDIGAYSSRPQSTHIPVEEEIRRLDQALKLLRREVPNSYISVDTFRADVARYCIEEHGVAMINDISGGELDTRMYDTIAELHVPYVIMHMRGTPQEMMMHTEYEHLIADLLLYFSQKINSLRERGVCDIIIDPGFGFSKTIDDNYRLMHELAVFQKFGLPILVGISRKSMIYKLLNTSPEESLNGTTVLNTLALMNGAQILRVHDVKEATEAITIVNKTLNA